jgi:hypothetical protein
MYRIVVPCILRGFSHSALNTRQRCTPRLVKVLERGVLQGVVATDRTPLKGSVPHRLYLTAGSNWDSMTLERCQH